MSATFPLVASSGFVPNASGFQALLPSGTKGDPLSSGSVGPLSFRATILGNTGTGSPVFKAQVLSALGNWLDIVNATITSNGTISGTAFGRAIRIVVPTLTAPGTGTTAPRCFLMVTPLEHAFIHDAQYYSSVANSSRVVAGASARVAVTPGYSVVNPNLVPSTSARNHTWASLEGGNGSGTLQGQYPDGTLPVASQWVNEGSLSSGQQVSFIGFAEYLGVNYTFNSIADTVSVDVLKLLN